MRNTFKGRTVIITGASSGIGKALALKLADEGAWLALAARDAQRLNSLKETYGHIDTLVNNAGIAVVSKLEDLPDLHLFKQVVDVNFYGTVHCTYHALPYLQETRGRIVNMSSLGGMLAIPFNTSYIASKFAVIGFSDSLRMEVEPAGVSVTVVCPSWVVTEFHERYLDKDGQSKGPSGRAIYTEQTMTADQCAQIVVRAARRRKRQVVMRPGPLALWLKLIAPGWVDRLIISRFLRPAVKRMLGDSHDSAIDKKKS